MRGHRFAPLLRAAARRSFVAFLAATIACAVYLATMNRTYGFIDKGELAAVATTLGIAHPTGYPTLTLLGHVVTRVSPLRPVLSLNILAALLTAGGVLLMTLAFSELLHVAADGGWPAKRERDQGEIRKARRHKGPGKSKEITTAAEVLPGRDRVFLAALAALFVGFTPTWWSQSSGFEVYALHAFLLPLVCLLFVRYVERQRSAVPSDRNGTGHAFAFFLGLAFTNHMSTIMLAPAFLFLHLRVCGWDAGSLRGIARLAPAFVIGLIPYAYLPARASMAPRLNWGNPSTWESFWAHVGGEQFHFAMFYAPRVFGQQTAYFFNTLASDTLYVGLALALLGMIDLFRRSARLAVWTCLLFVTCIAISGLYDINDIGNYHLTAVLAVGVACASGLEALRRWLGLRAALAVGLLLDGANGTLQFRQMDERRNSLVEDLMANVMGPLPQGAVVFSNDWDYWTSGSLYAQEVEAFRRDVVVVDPESLRAEWYLDQLSEHDSELVRPAAEEIARFRAQIRAFERAKGQFAPSEANAYFEAFYGMINALIDRNADQRPFFVTEHVDTRIGIGWDRTPVGLAYRLGKNEGYQAQPLPRYTFRPWTNRVDPYVLKICELYTMSLLARARYEDAHGHADKARAYGLYALSFDPGFREEDVPDFPLHIDDQVREVIRNYRQLRERALPRPAL